MQKELLIFVVLIGIIAALFNVSKTSAELTGNGELQKSDDIIYKAGDHFTLNINAAKTTDTSFGSKGKSKSKTFPFSEKWDDYGMDNCENKYEDGNGGCAKEAIQNGDMTAEELAEKVKDNISDPNGDDWKDCNDNQTVCQGDPMWKDDMGNNKWDVGEKLDGNGEYDFGEKIYDTDGNGTYTEDLLVFRWYKIEEEKNMLSGKQLKYVGLDGHTLNTSVCSVKDFVKNKCDDVDMFVKCGSMAKDKNGFTYRAPECEDFRFVDKKDGNQKSWILEYKGADVGELEINLKVLDLGSYYVNGDGKLMVHDEQFVYDCNRIKEEGPEISAKVNYKSNSPQSQ